MIKFDRPSFIAEHSCFRGLSVEKAYQYCDVLCNVLDMHATPFQCIAIRHNFSPWFETIRVVLLNAKRKRRQADLKWRNTKLCIFKHLYRQAKRNLSKFLHSANCQSYTEGIALASSSKERHQIVDKHSNRHKTKILPAIYPDSDLPSLLIIHFNDKVQKGVVALHPNLLPQLHNCYWVNYCNIFFI